MTAFALQIHAWPPLLAAAVLGIAAIGLLLRLPLPRLTRWLLLAAIVLLALAAGDPHTPLPSRGDLVVMVDLSPSTRSAVYRNRAALDARLKQLLGSRSYRLVGFAEDQAPLPPDTKLADLPAVQTRFAAPPADAIVLLSDGQFDLPASAPPTYPVIDPGLIEPADASVHDVRVDDRNADVTLTGRGPQRILSVTSAPPLAVSPRDTTVQRVRLSEPSSIGRAELSRGDPWPENDAVTFAPPQPPQRQLWWMGADPPTGWTAITPADLTPEELLVPGVIVLNNVPAGAIPAAAQDRLQQYVRDLGGSLLILGGDHAFAAGGYSGTTLDQLSPLASDPPTPTTHWLLLTDASGSMASDDKWPSATGALASVIRELPSADLVTAGSFAADLTWWFSGIAGAEARTKAVPPPGVVPSGPTNLQPVLQKLVDAVPADLQKELLILTDGETTLTAPQTLADAMKAKKLRLHVLAIGNGAALPALRSIAEATGGAYTSELDVKQWLAGARKLLQAARPDRIITNVGVVRDKDDTYARTVRRANRTWLKSGARLVAESQTDPMIANWQIGNGSIVAWAPFDPPDADVRKTAEMMGTHPRDPRFRVDWRASHDRVIVDATQSSQPMNHLPLELSLRPLHDTPTTLAFTQTAPGRYELQVPTSPQPRLAVLQVHQREVDRRTLAGRYAREFAGIGLDEVNLRELARRTGGRVIGPAETGPILPTLWRDAALAPWLAGLAAVLIGWGLLHWKRS